MENTSEEPSSSKLRILIADDSPGVRRVLRQILERGGYEVREAVNGKAALRDIKGSMVDLVITDLVMPDGEGLETIRTLRQNYPNLPVIAISGVPDPSYLRMAKFLGAGATLAKPILGELLLSEVRRLLPSK